MSRPVGARIITICELLERHGAMTRRQVFDLMTGVELANVHKYCHRAVGLQLLTINRSQRPAVFKITAGWRDRLGSKPHKPQVTNVAKEFIRPGPRLLTSVWDMGMAA